ncbi:MAG: dethiobiotin synthase [Planctomycetaceae bacterium]|nr:dethiobiotin synthase [Planctomycetaceae bacterium]
MQGLFITATDTGAGKTHCASLIASELRSAGHRVGCYKPVCSGGEVAADGRLRWEDIQILSDAIDHRFPIERICPQTFAAPLAPPAAARHENRNVDPSLLRTGAQWWSDRVDFLCVEGVGGLLCPLTETETVADLAGDLGFPLLIVCPLILGTINHTLLTIEVAEARNLSIAGLVLNHIRPVTDEVSESTIAEIVSRTTVPILATMPFNERDRLRPMQGDERISWVKHFGPQK